jgi:hypothetical protein
VPPEWRRIDIDYPRLQAMDRVDFAGRGLTADIIRARTAGPRYRRNYGVSIHTASVVNLSGQKMLIQMGAGGIECRDMRRYEYALSRSYILGIYRHPIMESRAVRETAQAALVQRWRRHVEGIRFSWYGWLDLPYFVWPWWPDSRYSICSEMYVESTEQWISYPCKKILSPYDLQRLPDFYSVGAVHSTLLEA